MAIDPGIITLDDIGRQDHSLTREYRIFGPPGTGKTTNQARQVRRAIEKYGADAVLVTSFSKTAAAELSSRDLPISSNQIGTLHSMCFHAVDQPEIAEANVADWIRAYPHLVITPVRKQRRIDGEEPSEDTVENGPKLGDRMLQELNRYRGLLIERRLWPESVRSFEQLWSRYKRNAGLLDFTDLIEICLRDVGAAPGCPDVIFADEAQDLNPMQLRLIRQWGQRAEYFILAGDDDQTVFGFAGASPDAILDPAIPEDHTIILTQSERVPRAIHTLAEKLIHTVTRRKEKLYSARPAEGSVVRMDTGTYKSTEYSIVASAMRHIEQGKTIMFLATCSYMLSPLIQILRKNAIPFHNPYRRANGFWNPLRGGKAGSTPRRILALLSHRPGSDETLGSWTCADLLLWAECLKVSGVLKSDAIERIRRRPLKFVVPIEQLCDFLEPAAFLSFREACARGGAAVLDWWVSRVNSDVHTRIQFAAEIARRRGSFGLTSVPQVVVGTIHSVKGGQADIVYLFPDLSRAGDAHYQRFGPARDSVIRLFYVGVTRARETLYICRPGGPLAVSI